MLGSVMAEIYYDADASNAQGTAHVFLRKVSASTLHLTLQWVSSSKRYDSSDESWVVNRYSTPEDIAACIERWVPKSPDPDLMNEALEKLNAQLPEGML